MGNEKLQEVKAWLTKAGNDLRGAEVDLAADPPLVEDALFHCQQAAEKAMKAFLTAHDTPFRKTHDLDELASACERIEYADRQIVMAATGGLLTILAQSGTGTLAGGAHNDTLIGLARADAMRISEVFQQQVDREILRPFFPGSLTCILTHQSSKRTTPAKKTNYSARNRKSRGGYVESSKRAVPGSNLWRHS